MNSLRFAWTVALVIVCSGDAASDFAGLPWQDEKPLGEACCDELPDFGTKLDFNHLGIPAGEMIGDQLIDLGVVFAPATAHPAPTQPDVEVASDAARPPGCRLTASGVPHFVGDEVMQFLSEDGGPMAVAKVGASVGLLNDLLTVFMSAYDCSGNLLAHIVSTETGFEFMTIELDQKAIHYVIWGDTGDTGGEAINCITYDQPIPCEPTPTEQGTWGRVKSLYR